jgi:hypothetical protein
MPTASFREESRAGSPPADDMEEVSFALLVSWRDLLMPSRGAYQDEFSWDMIEELQAHVSANSVGKIYIADACLGYQRSRHHKAQSEPLHSFLLSPLLIPNLKQKEGICTVSGVRMTSRRNLLKIKV